MRTQRTDHRPFAGHNIAQPPQLKCAAYDAHRTEKGRVHPQAREAPVQKWGVVLVDGSVQQSPTFRRCRPHRLGTHLIAGTCCARDNSPPVRLFCSVPKVRMSFAGLSPLPLTLGQKLHGVFCVQVTVLSTELKGHPGIRVEVRDTGVGVPVEQQAALFEPFRQADESISRHHGGTGLGLPIVKEFAAVMGGSAGCCSEPGEGSTFWFSFQADAVDDVVERPDCATEVSCEERWRVMVVDDTVMNLRLASHMLSHMACEGLLMDSGAAAVDYLRTSHPSTFPDIVFMDFCMPEMDGFETTAAILALCPDMPIVGLTADASAEHHQKAMRCGMRHVLVKPFRERDLAEACNRFGRQLRSGAGSRRASLQQSRESAYRHSVDGAFPGRERTKAWTEPH